MNQKESLTTIGRPVPELPVADVEQAQQYYVMFSALKSDGFIQGKRSALSHVEMWPSSSEDDKNPLNLRFIGYSLKT